MSWTPAALLIHLCEQLELDFSSNVFLVIFPMYSCCIYNRNYSEEHPAVLWNHSALDHTLAGCRMKRLNVCKLLFFQFFSFFLQLVKWMQVTSWNGLFHIQWYRIGHIPYPCHVLVYKYMLRASFLPGGTGGQINGLIKWRQNICGGWKGGRLSLEIFLNWLSQSTANPPSCTSLLHGQRRLEWKDNGYVTSMQ